MTARTICPVAFMVWCMAMGAGCSFAGPQPAVPDTQRRPELYISQVPFYPQEAYQCGPASLAAVLNYWGDSASPDEIAKAIYSSSLKGTLGMDMWMYAQARHFQAEMRTGSLKDLERLIQQNIPVIAFLDLGYDWFPVPHFVVVVGLDPHTSSVITYDGRKSDSPIPYPQFLSAWKKTDFWTLVVQPKTEAEHVITLAPIRVDPRR